MSALQALSKPQIPNVNSRLVLDALLSHHTVLQRGPHIVLQRIPGHSGIGGDVTADMVARCVQDSPDTSLVPY